MSDLSSPLRRRPDRGPIVALALLASIAFGAALLGAEALRPDFDARLLAPSPAHPFGTDRLGREMLARTLAGLGLSLQVGLLAAALSTVIALTLALLSGIGRRADAIVTFATDAALGLPHLVLLILVAFALGGGTEGVVVAVAVTHWPRLARVLRAELRAVQGAEFALASHRFGRSRFFALRRHILPHLLPQALVGFVLLFPHAILHEAGLTFLGFGLEPSRPAIGILLAEATRSAAAGHWWLALLPGLALLLTALSFDTLGNALRRRLDPRGGAAG